MMRSSGYLPVPGGMVWFRRTGLREKVPLLVLHGGPGAGGWPWSTYWVIPLVWIA